MHPNANVRERIALYRRSPMTLENMERIEELDRAYADWRHSGGFLADLKLLDELDRVRLIYR